MLVSLCNYHNKWIIIINKIKINHNLLFQNFKNEIKKNFDVAHSHWPLITMKSHKQPKKLQKIWVLNDYNAFQIGLRHLKLVLTCFRAQTWSSVAKFEIWVNSKSISNSLVEEGDLIWNQGGWVRNVEWISNSTFFFDQLASNIHNFLILGSICTPFETLDSWLPELQKNI